MKTLYNLDTDVGICLGDVNRIKPGLSASACALLALVVLLGRCKLIHEQVGVTGTVDLRGRVEGVGGLIERIRGAMKDEMDLLIVPSVSLEEVVIPPDIEEYTERAVRGVDNVVELLQLAIQGERRGNGFAFWRCAVVM